MIAVELAIAGRTRDQARASLEQLGFDATVTESVLEQVYPAPAPDRPRRRFRRFRRRRPPIEFYSLKHRRWVEVDPRRVQRETSERETASGSQVRYRLIANTVVDGEAVNLSKFVSKDEYDGF